MLLSGPAHVMAPGEGPAADLGIVQMRILAAGETTTRGAFSLAEFTGTSAGPWTVPHIHRSMDESFYILDGQFTFTVGEDEIPAGPGAFILVPRGARHVMRVGEGGGRLLTLMVPGGLEQMFLELATLPPGSLTDPQLRSAIAAKYDSVPA